jgi:5-methylcytosine-specific restriction endonuclease McrA
MPTRPCAGPAPGQPCPTRQLIPILRGSKTAARCGYCRAQWQQAKDGRRPMRRTYAEQQRRAQQVQAQSWCSGCGTTLDLTAEHLTPVAQGGSEDGPLTTLCRPCNAKRGARLGTR